MTDRAFAARPRPGATRYSAHKARAGGLVAALTVIALWLIGRIDGWNDVPSEVRMAVETVIAYGVGALWVWLTPNRIIREAEEGDGV